jgi:serine/threonine-protein kinase
VPGTILADRYRIVGLLGKGGMGEVYRADDLKLAQPVALKFLPDHLLSDSGALARFHREVRVARQVSHKNVCRVYDIGEVDGRHFLSMEFIKVKNYLPCCAASAACRKQSVATRATNLRGTGCRP